MKITCPSCQTENELDASVDQLIDASCQKCGGILPAAGARESLDGLRDELEQEVGSIFSEDPSRQIQTTPLRIGAEPDDDARSISSPAVPAFKVVETSPSSLPGSAVEVPAPASVDKTGDLVSSAEVGGDESDEAQWSPAAEDLSSLIEEQYSATRQVEQPERDDDMLKPPELKPKPAQPAGPPPPLAFDEDFKGQSSPHMQAVAPSGGRHGSMIGQAAVAIDPPRRRGLWAAAAVLAFIVVVGLLSVIVVLLWREQQPSAPTALAQTSTPPRVDPPRPPGGVDGVRARDAGAVLPLADASARPVSDAREKAPDARVSSGDDASVQGSRSVRARAASDPTKMSPKARSAPAKAPAGQPRALAPKPAGTKKAARGASPRPAGARVRWQPKAQAPPTPKPKPRSRSHRPKGCDPVLFEDPLDCPRAGPPGKAEILEVVRENVGDVDVCAKKQFAADPQLASGVIVMRFTIRPTGRTAKVAVISPEFKGSVVGACLTKKIKKWSFGAFDGRAVGPIKFPFKLRTR